VISVSTSCASRTPCSMMAERSSASAESRSCANGLFVESEWMRMGAPPRGSVPRVARLKVARPTSVGASPATTVMVAPSPSLSDHQATPLLRQVLDRSVGPGGRVRPRSGTGSGSCAAVTSWAPPRRRREGAGMAALPDAARMLAWDHDEKLLAFQNLPGIFATHHIDAAPAPFPLPRGSDLGDVSYERGGEALTFHDYLDRQNVVAMLVIKDGQVRAETYRHGTDETTHWTSWSVGKSVVSTLVGIALRSEEHTSELQSR